MAPGIIRRECVAGETIFGEGDESRSLFLLERGAVEIRRGGLAIAWVTDSGSFLGEMSFLLDRPRSGTAVAMEPSVVLVIPASEIERSVASDPRLAIKLARTLALRLARTSEQLKDLLESGRRREAIESFEAFVKNLPYSRCEQLLREAAQSAWFGRGCRLSISEARTRFRGLERDLEEMRGRRDLYADPVGRVAAEGGLADEYESRLRQEFGKLAG